MLCRNPYLLAKVLKEIHPRYVIMYDADVQFVRQVEVSELKTIICMSYYVPYIMMLNIIGVQG